MGSVLLTKSRKRPQGDQQAVWTWPPGPHTQRSVVHLLLQFHTRNTRSTVPAKSQSFSGDHLIRPPGGPKRFRLCSVLLSTCQTMMERSPIEEVASRLPSLFHCMEVMGRFEGLQEDRLVSYSAEESLQILTA